MMLLGIHGKKRSGKDTVANYLVTQYGAQKYSFAEPLREGCAAMFGIPIERFTDDAVKEAEDPFWGMTPRYILQVVGTEAMRRAVRDDIWVMRAKKHWREFQEYVGQEMSIGDMSFTALQETMVIPDVRFENEVDWIESEGGRVVHLDSKYGVGGDGHASEAGVRFRGSHHLVPNHGSLNQLYNEIDELLVRLGLL